jgi:sugar phosphate isomerase/epimerase
MKLGIGTYAFAWAIGSVTGHPPANPMCYGDFVRRCADLGVHVAQIADNLPLDALSIAEQDALKAEANDLGIAIEVGTRGIQPERLDTYLDIATRFESPILRTVIDSPGHKPAVPEIVGILREKKAAFEAAGVVLALENHDRFNTATFIDLLQQVDSPNVGICLDTVNSFGALEGPAVVVEALGPYVANLHVKDFLVRRIDHTMGFAVEGTPAGQGRLDVPWLLNELKTATHRDFNAILELWPPPVAGIEDTVQKEADWAVESVNYLRTLITD